MNDTIESKWKEFRAAAFQKDLPPQIEAHLRTCFFAGAFVALTEVTQIAEKEPEHVATMRVAAIHSEVIDVMAEIHNINKQRN